MFIVVTTFNLPSTPGHRQAFGWLLRSVDSVDRLAPLRPSRARKNRLIAAIAPGAAQTERDSHIDSQESDFGGHFGSQAVKAQNQPKVAKPSKMEALARTGENCQRLFWSG